MKATDCSAPPVRSRRALHAVCALVLLHASPLPAQDNRPARPRGRPDREAVRADMAGPQELPRFDIPATVELVPDIPYREGNEKWKLDLVRPRQPAGRAQPALVFIHGNKDDGTVPPGQSEELVAKLREATTAYAALMIVDGDGHGVFMQHREITLPAMEAFFVRSLDAADNVHKK